LFFQRDHADTYRGDGDGYWPQMDANLTALYLKEEADVTR
jgi:hypothetical protein